MGSGDNSYKTAITRPPGKLSAPIAYLNECGLLCGRVLDYGCGKGADAALLGLEKYDPYYQPNLPDGKFDTVVCTYVLCVLDEQLEEKVLSMIHGLLADGGKAYVTARSDLKESGFTSRGTYQRKVELDLPIEKKTRWYTMYRMEKKE